MPEERYFGVISESQLKAGLWSVIVILLGSIVWLAVEHPDEVRKTISEGEAAVSNSLAPLVHEFPNMQFGTLSRPTTVLFMGTDVVYTNTKRHQATVEAGSCRGNSDTMMLVFLNPAHNTISVLNIPRDTEANVGNSGIQKINSANVIGGPSLAKQTVTTLLDVPIDYYVIMNVQGLVQAVNELGGITVNVPKKMSYMDWTAKLKIDLQPGNHTLTGNQAMGFVRFRHDALGDIGRIQRQQIFLQAAMRKMLDPASWMHLNALLEIVKNNMQTDMSNVDMLQALNFVHSVKHENVKFVMLPGQFAGNGDWLANTDGKAIAQILANPDQETIRSRRNITVCIINASSDPTLGGKVSKALRKLGYMTCVGKDEHETTSGASRVIAQYGNVSEAKMMQQDLGIVGEVVNASVGNLTSSITVIAHDDIKLDQIKMSSSDAPYIAPSSPPLPLVTRPLNEPVLSVKQNNQSDLPALDPAVAGPQSDQQLDSAAYPAEPKTPDATTSNTDVDRTTIDASGGKDITPGATATEAGEGPAAKTTEAPNAGTDASKTTDQGAKMTEAAHDEPRRDSAKPSGKEPESKKTSEESVLPADKPSLPSSDAAPGKGEPQPE
jgi:LCP family protein required for cell wall assembly